MTPNQKAFLDMIAFSELGTALIAKSDNGYNVVVGSTPDHPCLFDSYADHPRCVKTITLNGGKVIYSSAAGRYQLLARYFDAYKKTLKLPDFSPDSQDRIALCQIGERHALDDIEAGRFDSAVAKCSNIWASLPGAGYGQHENDLGKLRLAYQGAGGTLA